MRSPPPSTAGRPTTPTCPMRARATQRGSWGRGRGGEGSAVHAVLAWPGAATSRQPGCRGMPSGWGSSDLREKGSVWGGAPRSRLCHQRLPPQRLGLRHMRNWPSWCSLICAGGSTLASSPRRWWAAAWCGATACLWGRSQCQRFPTPLVSLPCCDCSLELGCCGEWVLQRRRWGPRSTGWGQAGSSLLAEGWVALAGREGMGSGPHWWLPAIIA